MHHSPFPVHLVIVGKVQVWLIKLTKALFFSSVLVRHDRVTGTIPVVWNWSGHSEFNYHSFYDMHLCFSYCDKRPVAGDMLEAYVILVSSLLLSSVLLSCQASTPYSLESESLRMDCIMSGGASPTLAINAVTNKVWHRLFSYERFGFIGANRTTISLFTSCY